MIIPRITGIGVRGMAGAAGLLGLATTAALAQAPTPDGLMQVPAASAAANNETWKGPFGGTFSAIFTVTSDYSFRGLSQTQLQPAGQVGFAFETPPLASNIPISAYVGAWGSSVSYIADAGASIEVDLLTGLRGKFLNDKLTFDLGFIRYAYPGALADFSFDYDEYALVVGYDFDVVAVSLAVRYSPDLFANSGIAWYKWGQVTVPLPFIRIHDGISFKLFGTLGSQYVERPHNYGVPSNDYWDWQIGLAVSIHGFDLSASYVSTDISSANCGYTQICTGRGIVSLSKSF